MEGSDPAALDTSALLHRLAQLESERDGLRRSVEELSTTHTSGFGSLDFVARLQGRRSTTLEHELEACQQKLNSYKKENAKLQEELSEVYNIKSKFAELLKSERDKNNSLEKEVKFFQTRAAAALSDRDRCVLEVENFQRKEDAMTEEISELEDRLGEVTAKLGKVQSMSAEIQTELEKTQEKCEAYGKVVERMWKVREQATGFCDTEGLQNRADVLLRDSENLWSFGEMNRDLQLQLKQAKEDLEVAQKDFQNCSVSLAAVQAQLEKETLARKGADNAVLHCKEQMSCLTGLLNSKLQQLRTDKERLKEDIDSFLQEGKMWISSLSESWEYLIDNKVQEKSVISTGEERVVVSHADMQHESDETEDALKKPFYSATNTEFSKPEVQAPVTVDGTKEEMVLGDSERKGEQNLSKVINMVDQMSIDDNKKALAQALQEKVSTLLLLSQQEERHIFEANTTSALESQIAALKQQLLQVTGEKVNALVELARLHEECRKLQGNFKETLQHRRTFSGERFASIVDNGYSPLDVKHSASNAFENGKKSSMQGYLKHFWLRGPELGLRSRSLSHMWPSSKSKETETAGVARLQIENASLRESLSSIRHLCNSANRLRLTIAKVAAESITHSESSFQAAENAVDGVISEALHLKVALHDSAPANDLGWSSIGSPLARAGVGDVSHDGLDGEANDDLDIVSFFGLEIVRLVLLAAQLQKRCLGQSIQLQS